MKARRILIGDAPVLTIAAPMPRKLPSRPRYLGRRVRTAVLAANGGDVDKLFNGAK